MKKLIILCLALSAARSWGQCTSTVSPGSQAVSCSASPVANFTVNGVVPAINIEHKWYSPYNPAYPMLSSNSVTSTLSGSLAPGVYTVVTSYDNNTCSVSKTFTITSVDAYPTFSLSSPSNFSVGCAPLNQTTLSIINPVSTQTPPSICSYTFLYPSFNGVVTQSMVLDPVNSSTVTSIPGTWTVIVQDNANFCRNIVPVPVFQNTIAPQVGASLATRTLMCNTPTILATGSSTTANTVITWNPPANPLVVTSSTLAIGNPLYGPPTSTALLAYANFTVVATNSLNGCQTTSVIAISQNFKPPVSSPQISIATPTAIDCNNPLNPVVLSAGSSTTTSGGGPTAFPIVDLWQGPAPQPTASGASSYSCYVPGIYSLTIRDNYNGCTSIGTVIVVSNNNGTLVAAFSHTSGPMGVVNFSSTSVGTNSNTIYNWNFGDGYLGTGATPTHTYTQNGSYPVMLSVNNGTGCSGSATQYINVGGLPCSANASFSMIPTNTTQYWSVVPFYPYNVINAEWNWGDNSTSNILFTSHTYSAAGIYTICLSVTVSCMSSTTSCQTQYISRSATENNSVIHVDVLPPPPISVKENGMEEINYSVYPNPNNGKFGLNLVKQNTEPVHIKIMDVIGHCVYEKHFENTEDTFTENIDAGHLPTGIYFIKVENGNSASTKKLVISK